MKESVAAAGEAGVRCHVLVPAYREARRIAEVVASVRSLGLPVLVVDDGSPDETAQEAERGGAEVIRHAVNRGKGAAVATGIERLKASACDCVLTMDGDGQHLPEDIPGFLEAFRASRPAAIVGNRMDNPVGMPLVRRLTNRYMSWLLSRRMGQRVPDTQCGFRLYRADVLHLLGGGDERFAAESEILLRLSAAGHRIESVPIQVVYRDEKSKISPIRDTIRFWRMLRGQPRS